MNMTPTIYRKQVGHDLKYFVHFEGQYVEVSERIALSHQRTGKAKIRTIETR